ncbi:MAG: hypothetical protein K6E10_05520 [Eubacterium sp.]|nr:hypothetical protein [Eubacterium sp.]
MKKYRIIRIAMAIILFIVVCTNVSTVKEVEALTPRVMMTSYSLSSDEIYAGDSFDVSFTLKNTSKNTIMNLKCTVYSEDGSFIPSNSTGTDYVAEIRGEQETELSFSFDSLKNLKQKTYKLKVKLEYEDWSKSYKVEEDIYVPIRLKTDVMVSDTYIADEEIHLGDNVEIVSTINNVGASDIYKVSVSVNGDVIGDANTFIGNVKAGKNASIDIITKATQLSRKDGDKNTLVITYEDQDGNEFTIEESIGTIDVMEQDYSDIIQIKEDTTKQLTDIQKLGIVIGLAVLVIIILIIRRISKRKKLERDFD